MREIVRRSFYSNSQKLYPIRPVRDEYGLSLGREHIFALKAFPNRREFFGHHLFALFWHKRSQVLLKQRVCPIRRFFQKSPSLLLIYQFAKIEKRGCRIFSYYSDFSQAIRTKLFSSVHNRAGNSRPNRDSNRMKWKTD